MDVQTIIAITVAFIALVGMIGGLIVRDRQTMRAISDGDGEVHRRVDEITRDYVQKKDLEAYLKPVQKSIDEMHNEQRETNKRIDRVLEHIPKRSTD